MRSVHVHILNIRMSEPKPKLISNLSASIGRHQFFLFHFVAPYAQEIGLCRDWKCQDLQMHLQAVSSSAHLLGNETLTELIRQGDIERDKYYSNCDQKYWYTAKYSKIFHGRSIFLKSDRFCSFKVFVFLWKAFKHFAQILCNMISDRIYYDIYRVRVLLDESVRCQRFIV
jgi:hypothetical protein